MKIARASRFVALAVALSIFTSSVMAPRRAEAGWGLLLAALTGSATGALNVGSLIFFAGSVGGVLTGVHLSNKAAKAPTAKAVALYLVAGLAAIGALYLLDTDEAGQDSNGSFASMSDDAASRLGVSADEQQAFNAELPLINAVKEEVLLRAERDLSGLAADQLTADQASVAIRRQWQDLASGSLSAEAISAVEKIGRAI